MFTMSWNLEKRIEEQRLFKTDYGFSPEREKVGRSQRSSQNVLLERGLNEDVVWQNVKEKKDGCMSRE